ncbi:tRNA pseudouridine(38-40) synthase TruA [Lactonifactor longoviformis]|uniref:tRNA pseudouridine(38-40) synthase TruA n=1 Tax=Lactonifactor longoviformis TaxID=341220 RepID=UPI00210C0EED|nr:tRNA pseudouridine(38-40) synthase TruA [Lactonifactor longoviformis]MCQ4671245.1 tRNA pseudouridine(38-40) synthase TruA [Lactonifactor longoviformis]
MNYKLIIQYDGTRYDGWQRQGNTENTIQGRIEEVLSRMVQAPVEVQGAGRTDAGVHALGQVASVYLDTDASEDEICQYLNLYLPEDIGVVEVRQAADRFHARLNASGKVYRYRIGIGAYKNVFERKYYYPLGKELDVAGMREAAALLVGEHDFKSFCSNKRMKKSTVRRLRRIDIREKAGEIEITYEGDGFLYNMVRILTGTLIEVGQGKRCPDSMKEILVGRNRKLAGYTAPARGLILAEVKY